MGKECGLEVTYDLNKDLLTVAPQDVAQTPRPDLGIVSATQAAYEAYTYVYNPVGFERLLHEADLERVRVARDAGFEPPSLINDMQDDTQYLAPYTEFQRTAFERDGFVSSASDEGRRQFVLNKRAEAANKHADEWRKFSQEHPELNIPDNDKLREQVKARGQAIYERWEGGRTTWPGMVGGLVGAGVGAMTNPLTAVSTFASGGGSGALARIAFQFGLNAGAEAISKVTGELENQRWFGVEPTLTQTLTEIGTAGLVPAGFQAVGEAAVKGISKMAGRTGRRVPSPAPEPVPTPETPPAVAPVVVERQISAPQISGVDAALARFESDPFMKVRAAKDADAMGATLNRWGTAAEDAVPPTIDTMTNLATPTKRLKDSTALRVRAGETQNTAALNVLSDIAKNEGLYDAAANLDPQVFKALEKLTAQLDSERAGKATDISLIHDRLNKVTTTHDRLVAEQAAILANPKATNAAKQRAAARVEELGKIQKGEKTPQLSARLDRELEAKIAALQPAVERALARAQGVWEATAKQKATLAEAAKTGDLERAVRQIQSAYKAPKLTPYETVAKYADELRSPDALPARDGETVIQTVNRVNEANRKRMDDAAEAFIGKANSALKGFDERQPLELAGENNKVFGGEESGLVDANGKSMTVKEAMEDLVGEKELFDAVSRCQIG